ncbi:MAG: hypothetical protein WCP62_12370 [Planctomycetota bacterium]
MSEGDLPSPDELARRQTLLKDSVCLNCQDHRTIISGRGSVFLLCQSEKAPEHWPKYPRQPLFHCPYFSQSLPTTSDPSQTDSSI